jgi:hypothetical protein
VGEKENRCERGGEVNKFYGAGSLLRGEQLVVFHDEVFDFFAHSWKIVGE